MRKAFVIDDEEDICLLLSRFLKRNQFQVEYAMNLKDGLENIESNKVDLLFLDNNLPDGSGIEHVKDIKMKFPEIKIVVISAMSNLESRALEVGADDFIAKPISFQAISKYI